MKALKDGKIIFEDVIDASTFLLRFKGLMFKKRLDKNNGLLLDPCNSIHTFFMKFRIDAIFLDDDGKVIRVEEDIAKRRVIKPVFGARKILEVNSGECAKKGICNKDKIEFIK